MSTRMTKILSLLALIVNIGLMAFYFDKAFSKFIVTRTHTLKHGEWNSPNFVLENKGHTLPIIDWFKEALQCELT